jgi:hypothetical protein
MTPISSGARAASALQSTQHKQQSKLAAQQTRLFASETCAQTACSCSAEPLHSSLSPAHTHKGARAPLRAIFDEPDANSQPLVDDTKLRWLHKHAQSAHSRLKAEQTAQALRLPLHTARGPWRCCARNRNHAHTCARVNAGSLHRLDRCGNCRMHAACRAVHRWPPRAHKSTSPRADAATVHPPAIKRGGGKQQHSTTCREQARYLSNRSCSHEHQRQSKLPKAHKTSI